MQTKTIAAGSANAHGNAPCEFFTSLCCLKQSARQQHLVCVFWCMTFCRPCLKLAQITNASSARTDAESQNRSVCEHDRTWHTTSHGIDIVELASFRVHIHKTCPLRTPQTVFKSFKS